MAKGGKGGGLAAGIGCLVIAAAALLFAPIALWIFTLAAATGPTVEAGQDSSICRVVAREEADGDSLRGVPSQWVDDVEKAADVAGVPAPILAAQIGAESDWNPRATSGAGAAGLTQFMPGTWAAYGKGDPFDPEESIAAMGRYMKALMLEANPHADGDGNRQIRLSLAAYNWGPGSMSGNGWKLEGLPGETSDYLEKILGGGQTDYSQECEAFGGQWDGDLGDGEWTIPLPGGKMTSAGGYGPRNIPGYPAWANNHAGIDLATPDGGGTVIAPMPLRVTGLYPIDGCVLAKATKGPAFGLEFCHLDEVYVKVGQKLDRGGKIGEEGGVAGNLGGRTVEHLHYAMYDPSGPDPQFPGHQNPVIDPTPLLRQKGAL